MATKRAAARRAKSAVVHAEDIFSAEYLAYARAPNQLGFIFDPRNRLNQGQVLQAADTFTQAKRDSSVLGQYGIRMLSKGLAGEWMVVRIEDQVASLKLRVEMPSMEVIRAQRLQPQWAQAVVLDVDATIHVLSAGARRFNVTVVDDLGVPVADAKVLVIFDSARKLGAEVRTNAAGKAALAVPATWERVESFAVVPVHSLWSYAVAQWPIPTGDVTVALRRLDSAGAHPLRHHVDAGNPLDGQGVVVGIIDSGVGPHPDLTVAGGGSSVIGEVPTAGQPPWADNGLGHGTHVAGIVAGRGTNNAAYCGIAPGVTLRAYRVFASGARDCDDAAVSAAIEDAVADGCDLLNLSLGFEYESRAITRALRGATAAGTVAIAAVGNGGRKPVYFPAATAGVIAVSAIGRADRVPVDTMSWLAKATPVGTDPQDFLAAFTNIGAEVTATAPGVGIISCFPGGFYAAEDGTSMASPVVTGLAARELSRHPAILQLPRDQTRADAIRTLTLSAARRLGFQPECVGNGLP